MHHSRMHLVLPLSSGNYLSDALFHDVYTRLSDLHLADIGVEVEWSDVDITQGDDEERWGNTRKYFAIPIYRLPVGKMRAM
jgi:type IV protein arginine methyltransferase